MREIHGVDKALAVLAPHRESIENWFQDQNRRFLGVIDSDHDALGRVLKCHLTVETFLTEFLEARIGEAEVTAANLTFYQKASLLPASGSPASFIKPGILTLNRIRNRFSHRPRTTLHIQDLESIVEVLELARPGVDFAGTVERVEAFAAIACAFLLVAPVEMQTLFDEAFAHVHALGDGGQE